MRFRSAHRRILLALFLGAIAGVGSACTPNQVLQTVSEGQLICQAHGAFDAMETPTAQPQPVLATGKPKAVVDAICASLDGVAVSPPPPGVPLGLAAAPPALAVTGPSP